MYCPNLRYDSCYEQVQGGGLQLNNCGTRLLLVNALTCNLLTTSTLVLITQLCLTTVAVSRKTFLLSPPHTHLINLGHATAVGHLDWNGKTQVVISIGHVTIFTFMQ